MIHKLCNNNTVQQIHYIFKNTNKCIWAYECRYNIQ